MHAEKCPVCSGEGKLPLSSTQSDDSKRVCHGCNGKGWVSVLDTCRPWEPPIESGTSIYKIDQDTQFVWIN